VIRSWTRTATPDVVVLAATTVTDPATLAAFAAAARTGALVAGERLLWRGGRDAVEAGIAAVAGSATAATGADGDWIAPPTALLVDAATDAGRARAERMLFTRLGRAGDSWFTRTIDRRLSRAITRVLLPTGVVPNVVTVCSILIGVTGGVLFASGDRAYAVAGSLLFLLSTIIDGCDGEIARLTFRESHLGARLDVIGDNVVHLFLFGGIAVGLYRAGGETRFAVLGVLLVGGLLCSMAAVWWSFVRRDPTLAQRRLFEAFASREFAYAIVALTALGLLEWFLWAAVVGNYVFSATLLALGARQRSAV
jgi:phosphatidylglycerophosphate synthase